MVLGFKLKVKNMGQGNGRQGVKPNCVRVGKNDYKHRKDHHPHHHEPKHHSSWVEQVQHKSNVQIQAEQAAPWLYVAQHPDTPNNMRAVAMMAAGFALTTPLASPQASGFSIG